MNLEWLNKNNHSSLILFFSGWGGCKALFEHLSCDKHDVLYIDDYREISEIADIQHYDSITLIAWSFGIAASQTWQENFGVDDALFSKKIAINGTPHPVDRKLGIPPKVMQLTIDTLTSASLKKFHRRCGIPQKCSQADIRQLQDELRTIGEREYNHPSTWNTAIISDKDAIFSEANLKRAWSSLNTPIHNLIVNSLPHYPFQQWHTWQEIVDN